jgi:hypothetical protein
MSKSSFPFVAGGAALAAARVGVTLLDIRGLAEGSVAG